MGKRIRRDLPKPMLCRKEAKHVGYTSQGIIQRTGLSRAYRAF